MNRDIKIRNVKVVIWDCDNTIWIHREDEAEVLAKQMGIPFLDEFKKQYLNMFTQFNQVFSDKKATVEETLKMFDDYIPLLRQNNITSLDFYKKIRVFKNHDLNEEAIETMKTLKLRGYKNSVLTDWFLEQQMYLLKKYEILPYIEKVYACDNQYLKCNPKSAGRIIEKGKESQYVIIGDSLHSDIAFANHTGIHSIWYNPKHKENTSDYIPTAEVPSLLEIPNILE